MAPTFPADTYNLFGGSYAHTQACKQALADIRRSAPLTLQEEGSSSDSGARCSASSSNDGTDHLADDANSAPAAVGSADQEPVPATNSVTIGDLAAGLRTAVEQYSTMLGDAHSIMDEAKHLAYSCTTPATPAYGMLPADQLIALLEESVSVAETINGCVLSGAEISKFDSVSLEMYDACGRAVIKFIEDTLLFKGQLLFFYEDEKQDQPGCSNTITVVMLAGIAQWIHSKLFCLRRIFCELMVGVGAEVPGMIDLPAPAVTGAAAAHSSTADPPALEAAAASAMGGGAAADSAKAAASSSGTGGSEEGSMDAAAPAAEQLVQGLDNLSVQESANDAVV